MVECNRMHHAPTMAWSLLGLMFMLFVFTSLSRAQRQCNVPTNPTSNSVTLSESCYLNSGTYHWGDFYVNGMITSTTFSTRIQNTSFADKPRTIVILFQNNIKNHY